MTRAAADQRPRPPAEPKCRQGVGLIGGAGTLLLIVAVLCFIWPVLAVLVLAGAGAMFLTRRGLCRAAQAWRGRHVVSG